MAIHKYIFWITEKGVQTYKPGSNKDFSVIPFHGEDTYPSTDLKDFAKWFNKNASIADDDFIDFCYLSNAPINSQIFEYPTKEVSSWRKEDVIAFCEMHPDIGTCEVIIDDNAKFVCQSGNVYNKKELSSVYLKCVPNFLFDPKAEEIPASSKADKPHSPEEPSLLNRYFIDMLKNI